MTRTVNLSQLQMPCTNLQLARALGLPKVAELPLSRIGVFKAMTREIAVALEAERLRYKHWGTSRLPEGPQAERLLAEWKASAEAAVPAGWEAAHTFFIGHLEREGARWAWVPSPILLPNGRRQKQGYSLSQGETAEVQTATQGRLVLGLTTAH